MFSNPRRLSNARRKESQQEDGDFKNFLNINEAMDKVGIHN
jgi:hypothetical protein